MNPSDESVADMKTPHCVRIEVKRVQSFLFAVPRLRAMLGANSLLGETVRIDLPRIATESSAALPLELEKSIPVFEPLPDDPLGDSPAASDGSGISLGDAPRELYRKGILVRDAGRFIGIFPDKEKAETFIRKAEAKLAERLPGVRYELRVERLEPESRTWVEASAAASAVGPEIQIAELPVSQPCEESGVGAASEKREVKRRTRAGWETDVTLVSRSVALRLDQGDKFVKGETRDLIGLLGAKLALARLSRPWDFDHLTSGGYLAVIHADGNGIGELQKRMSSRANAKPPEEPLVDWFAREAARERFFHTMRARVRIALANALEKVFPEDTEWGVYRPYQVMMLGGDDLLLVCRAKYALPFVVEYARSLGQCTLGEAPEFSIGAGVVIAPSSLPFHRLHALAEGLAASAKTLYRGGLDASVVDWMVCTNAWAPDPLEDRRRFDVVEYVQEGRRRRLVINARPYQVLGEELDSLEGLLKRAEMLSPRPDAPVRAARSQLKALPDKLRLGMRAGELAFNALPPRTRGLLVEAGFKGGPWRSAGKDAWLSYLSDLIEVSEIGALGQTDRRVAGTEIGS